MVSQHTSHFQVQEALIIVNTPANMLFPYLLGCTTMNIGTQSIIHVHCNCCIEDKTAIKTHGFSLKQTDIRHGPTLSTEIQTKL